MLTPVIDVQTGRVWQNWHATRGVGGSVGRLYTPHNAWSDGTEIVGKRFAAPRIRDEHDDRPTLVVELRPLQ